MRIDALVRRLGTNHGTLLSGTIIVEWDKPSRAPEGAHERFGPLVVADDDGNAVGLVLGSDRSRSIVAPLDRIVSSLVAAPVDKADEEVVRQRRISRARLLEPISSDVSLERYLKQQDKLHRPEDLEAVIYTPSRYLQRSFPASDRQNREIARWEKELLLEFADLVTGGRRKLRLETATTEDKDYRRRLLQYHGSGGIREVLSNLNLERVFLTEERRKSGLKIEPLYIAPEYNVELYSSLQSIAGGARRRLVERARLDLRTNLGASRLLLPEVADVLRAAADDGVAIQIGYIDGTSVSSEVPLLHESLAAVARRVSWLPHESYEALQDWYASELVRSDRTRSIAVLLADVLEANDVVAESRLDVDVSLAKAVDVRRMSLRVGYQMPRLVGLEIPAPKTPIGKLFQKAFQRVMRSKSEDVQRSLRDLERDRVAKARLRYIGAPAEAK